MPTAKPKLPPAAVGNVEAQGRRREEIDDQIQRHKELFQMRREESRRKVLGMKPTAAFDDNAKIFSEFLVLCGCQSGSLPYRFQGSSSSENFGLHLRTYTYDDIEEALRLEDVEHDIEEGEIV
ncbi:hypothetical protein CCACVL1_30989 [Corchorus capsularis]|uniref:Uncharacterized protein n=1 Tax=Corchorus capsularis TaxID=210143 RepID=A0A1R3FUK4_COCAP|nr:hypothetical protein CCACVL1_30989 [Corchorus capsularis]